MCKHGAASASNVRVSSDVHDTSAQNQPIVGY